MKKCKECGSYLYGGTICSVCGYDNLITIMPELKKELKWRKLKENKLTRPFLNGNPVLKKRRIRFNFKTFLKTFFISLFLTMIILKVIQILLGFPKWYPSFGYILMWSFPSFLSIKKSLKR